MGAVQGVVPLDLDSAEQKGSVSPGVQCPIVRVQPPLDPSSDKERAIPIPIRNGVLAMESSVSGPIRI